MQAAQGLRMIGGGGEDWYDGGEEENGGVETENGETGEIGVFSSIVVKKERKQSEKQRSC